MNETVGWLASGLGPLFICAAAELLWKRTGGRGLCCHPGSGPCCICACLGQDLWPHGFCWGVQHNDAGGELTRVGMLGLQESEQLASLLITKSLSFSALHCLQWTTVPFLCMHAW